MPHVIVKLWPGKSDEQKHRLADAITRSVTDILVYGDDAVSVAFLEVAPDDWTDRVYTPDIPAIVPDHAHLRLSEDQGRRECAWSKE